MEASVPAVQNFDAARPPDLDLQLQDEEASIRSSRTVSRLPSAWIRQPVKPISMDTTKYLPKTR